MTTLLKLKNPRFLADGRIQLDALFDDSPNGEYESHVVCPRDEPTKANHARALRGDFGPVAAYVPPTPAEIVARKAEAAREKRTGLLVACDWTQFPDVPEQTRMLWQPYRQALREITAQENFPNEVEWPDAPE